MDDSGNLEIGFNQKFEYDSFTKDKVEKLTDIIGEAVGKHINIVTKDASSASTRVGMTDLRDIIKNPNVPIEVI